MQHRLPRRVVVLANVAAGPRELRGGLPLDSGAHETAQAVVDAIRSLDVAVVERRVTSSLSGLVFEIGRVQADVVFNLVQNIHGDVGRAWQVPALLDRHRIAYTGNSALLLRACCQKDRLRRTLSKLRVPVATDFGEASSTSAFSAYVFPDPATGYAVARGAPSELRAEVETLAYRTMSALGGTGYGRVGFSLDAAGKPWVRDVQPNCDLHPRAELTIAAQSLGWDFPMLIGSLLTHAVQSHERHEIDVRSHYFRQAGNGG